MNQPAGAELAIVIVNYNTRGYLERCLASLETHRGEITTDVLVIDNASRDGSHLRAVAAHPWARLIENPRNIYLSPAWNQGIRETDAPYVLLLNPDAEMLHGTLADYVVVAREHPRAGIVGPAIRNPDGTMYPSGRPLPSVADAVGHAFLSPFAPANPFTRRYHMEGWDRTTERTVDWVSGACMLMPRAALEAVGAFDEGFPLYAEELDMATRLRGAGWSVLFTPKVEIIHALGVSTGRSRRMSRMHSRSIFRYYRKHRAGGWRKVTVPFAWAALTLRAEIDWLKGRFVR
ncbi:MAG: N-acetylglucosaminyl-diphospho-decaprenol L-rhamnosyltransferase [Actinomycetota bacterium]|nr:N-acetylglucosaminyl-diphospho-decaprenol L-rhamnosyltransferase [Actinomycetota bacterium]